MLYLLLILEALLLALTTLTSSTSLISNDVSALEATDAVIEGHLFPTCNGRQLGKPRKPINVPVDRCLNIPSLAVVIKTAATCANGTRAQWARFPEKGCGYGTLDAEFSLVELEAKNIGTCVDIIGIESMAFWCNGLKKSNPSNGTDDKEPEDADKSKEGSVSESACMPRKAPAWKHTKADTCVNLTYERMKVYSAAVCANGTQSTLALYKAIGCLGAPSEFRAITEEETRACLDVEEMNSYAFYCTGEGLGRSRDSEPGRNGGGGGGSVKHFLLIIILIITTFFLMLLLTILAWVQKYGGSLGKLIEFARVSRSPQIIQVNINTELRLEPREAQGRKYQNMRSALKIVKRRDRGMPYSSE
jgi:hypothetical protein